MLQTMTNTKSGLQSTEFSDSSERTRPCMTASAKSWISPKIRRCIRHTTSAQESVILLKSFNAFYALFKGSACIFVVHCARASCGRCISCFLVKDVIVYPCIGYRLTEVWQFTCYWLQLVLWRRYMHVPSYSKCLFQIHHKRCRLYVVSPQMSERNFMTFSYPVSIINRPMFHDLMVIILQQYK